MILVLTAAFPHGACTNQVKTPPPAKDSTLPARDYFREPVSQYSKSRVLAAVYHTDSSMLGSIPGIAEARNIEYFFSQMGPLADSLLARADSRLTAMPRAAANQWMARLLRRLDNDALLQAILNDRLNSDVFFEELIAELPQTKHLLKHYLTDSAQYWGSLSDAQVIQLYEEVLDYIGKLHEKERLALFRQYFDLAFTKAAANREE